MTLAKRTLYAAAALLALLQAVPVRRTNPEATAPIDAPPEVARIIEAMCYDCHSNETRWPLYAYVAPVSWFVVHDVSEGREHLNFSEWAGYSDRKQRRLVEDICEEIAEGNMPLRGYLLIHPGARVTEAQLETLRRWAESDFGAETVRSEGGRSED
jgi:hypothetical protein